MTLLYILIAIYIISVLIVGSIHWAAYQDEKKRSEPRMEDKVMSLYVVPFTPLINTVVAASILIKYLESN